MTDERSEKTIEVASPSLVPGQIESQPTLVCHGRFLGAESGVPSSRVISIVLPVKNAASDLRQLLPRILGQQCDDHVELVAIDSGSVDDTVDVLEEFGATVLSVAPDSFDYGLTRNIAVRYTKGEILVFVTARALPANDRWLANLVEPLAQHPQVAGVYSRCLPRPDADLLTRRDDLHWTSILCLSDRFRTIENRKEYERLSPFELYRLVTFSNVSAAIRRTIFAQIPFPEATHGEDMIWARKALEAGFTICYEPTSVVLRSHKYSYFDLLRRSFDAGIAAREIANYVIDLDKTMETLTSSTLNDWRYLELGCRMSGEIYDRWRVVAVLRRAAQVIGFWLGANESSVPSNIPQLLAFLADACPSPEVAEYLERLTRTNESDDGGPRGGSDGTAIVDAILNDWKELDDASPSPEVSIEHQQLHLALLRIADIGGSWIGTDTVEVSGDLKSSLSLIRQIKAGVLTEEMKFGLGSPQQPGIETVSTIGETFDEDRSVLRGQTKAGLESLEHMLWHGDAESLLAVIDAYEAEWLTTHSQLQTVHTVWDREIGHRDKTIANIQSAMQLEIDHRERVIADLRQAMEEEIQHREETIRELVTEMRKRESSSIPLVADMDRKCDTSAIKDREDSLLLVKAELQHQQHELNNVYRSKTWRLMSHYWVVREQIRRTIGRIRARHLE